MAKRLLSTQRIVNLAADPLTGTAGEIYYNTVSNSFKYYNGSAWVVLSAGGSGNSFTTIDVPSGTDPVADSSSDTLSLTASNGISITGNSSTDTIDFSTNATSLNTASTIVSRDADQAFDITAIDFDTTDTITSAVGRLTWDDGEGTLNFGLKGGNVNLQIGQENIALCYNGTGSTITKGSVVYISGAQGQRPSITLSDADTEATSSKTFGVAAENISNGAEGFVCTFGVVTGVDTSSFTAGQALWLSSTAGQLTNVVPTQPAHAVFVGYCLSVNATSGRIFVNPQNGYELQELHNVLINGIADNHILSYDNATSLWKNQGLAAAIQEVDGASSGIDADLLDGQHAAAFGLVSGKLSQFSATTSAELAGVISDETGSGSLVFGTSPTITTRLVINGPTTADATSEFSITGVSGYIQFHNALGQGSYNGIVSANDKALIFTDGTADTGAFVIAPWSNTPGGLKIDGTGRTTFGNTVFTSAATTTRAGFNLPHGTAPTAPTNGDIWTTTSGLFARINGATQQYAPTSGTLAQFAATTSAQLAGVISDETGTGSLVFATSPTLVTPNIGAATGTSLSTSGAITASATNGRVSLGLDAGGSISLGRIDNTSNTPYIDFNSGATTVDFDVRVQASGGDGANGNGTLTVTGVLATEASTTTHAGFRLPHGTAPTAPTNGDIWTTTSGLFARINSTTEQYAKLNSPIFTGVPVAPTATAGTNTTQIATTAFVGTAISNADEIAYQNDAPTSPTTGLVWIDSDSTAAALDINLYAPKASPALTGTPTAPTAAVDTSTTQLATTAFVINQGYIKNSTASSTFLTQASATSTYAPLSSPTLTGVPVAPTASAGTNTTQIATTAFVRTEVSNLIASAPAALDTLDELAAALGDDANFATTVNTALSNRVLTTGGSTVTVSTGTTVPLTIQNNGTGNSFVVNDEGSDTSPFIIDATGNILIGTTQTPSNLDTVTPKLILSGSGTLGSAQIIRNSTPGGGGGILTLSSNRGADVSSHSPLQSGDGIGSIIFSGSDGGEYVVGARIVAQVDGTPGDNDMPTRITFNTTPDGSASPIERMRINSSGNIGIGSTATDGFSLTVKGTEIGNAGNSRILAYSGTTTSPVENADWPTPVLSLRAFGDFYANSMLSFGYPNDSEYQTGSNVWVFRLSDTAGGTPSRISSSSTTNLALTGPGAFELQGIRLKGINGSIIEMPIVTNAQTGTSYTLVLADAGKAIEMNNASANTLTVPTDASVNFPVGTVIDIFQTGAGQTTVGGAGVTINARPGLKLSGQWATATLIKRATNTWLLTGSLSA